MQERKSMLQENRQNRKGKRAEKIDDARKKNITNAVAQETLLVLMMQGRIRENIQSSTVQAAVDEA